MYPTVFTVVRRKGINDIHVYVYKKSVIHNSHWVGAHYCVSHYDVRYNSPAPTHGVYMLCIASGVNKAPLVSAKYG